MKEFKKRLFGKWVLSGEYSVLRGSPALVYPLKQYYIDFHYLESDHFLQIKRQGKYQTGLEFSIVPLFEKALKRIGKTREDLKGSLTIKGFIPFGTGLGASSAVCVGTASLFAHKKWLRRKEIQGFATSLENLFHGQSSGMDITAVLKEKPVLYQNRKKTRVLPAFANKPLLFLSYSGGRSPTSEGVFKVKKFLDKNWKQAQQTDQEMSQSVKLCLKALKEKNKSKCYELLKSALDLGENCFRKWNLISYDLERHFKYLKKNGALALKPTGSGLGGHVISLWEKTPPPGLRKKLIPLNI